MSRVEIYTTPICGFCRVAKRLLASKGAECTEYDVMAKPALRSEMVQRANGKRTVPQIFINGIHVGGCDDLQALERAGKLSPMLAG